MNEISELSYEASMLRQFKMPNRKDVENALIIFLKNLVQTKKLLKRLLIISD